MEYIKKSYAAGVLIGLGTIINALISSPVLGALLFAFGLLTIINLSLPLYTGKIGFICTKGQKYEWHYYFDIFLFNLLGIVTCVFAYIIAKPDFLPTLIAIAALKFTKTYLQIFIYGIFCGILIHLAVKNRNPLITCMAIIIFILMGAEHCIVAYPFLLLNCNFVNLIKYLLIVFGNSLGAIFIEKLLD